MVSLAALLLKKTLRELLRLAGPAITLSLVTAAGLSSLILARSNLGSLRNSQKLTYQNLNFADAAIPLIRMPRESLPIVQKIEGIRQADCRISQDGQVRLPREQKQIAARFHSLPEKGSQNRVKLMQGRMPEPLAPTEALVSDAFAVAWKLKLHDRIETRVRGKKIFLTITGFVRSAEYIYQTGSAGSIPDDKLFSAWWVGRRMLEQTADLQSSCNELLLSFTKTESLRLAEPELAMRLRPFGFTQIIPRSRQLSHYFLESEMQQLAGMSLYMPALFLAVTIFLLSITMNRMLGIQRESIGTLRAFGFPKHLISAQALLLAFFCLTPGCILGVAGGEWLAKQMFAIYVLFYRFPVVEYSTDVYSILIAVLLSAATAVAGTLTGLRQVFSEQPASTLIPAAPRHTRASMLDSIALFKHLNLTLRMSLRNILRRPFQSIVACFGLMLAAVLFVFARFEQDAIGRMIDVEYNVTQRQSHTLTFAQRSPVASLGSVAAALPAEGSSEVKLMLPVTLKYRSGERQLTLNVRDPAERLREADRIPVRSRTGSGLILPKSTAEVLGIPTGARVTLVTADRKQQTAVMTVGQLSENLMGTIASLSLTDFEKEFDGGHSFNAILYKTPRGTALDESRLFSKFPRLIGVSDKRFEKEAFSRTMAENIGIFRDVMIGFALLIAVGVLYNNARIQFAEREREFAMLRALGFYESEITLLFWSDFAILTAISIIPGLWLGKQTLVMLMRALETEVFRIPAEVSPQSYFWSSAMIALGVILAAIVIQPKISKIQFISILKSRE